MKVLRLRFKNINSFYGKLYTVDFTTSPLSDTGLFIISGPTGAGKSTLLDVITLALFNEVPRFERGVSKTEIDKLGSVVNTKAADEHKCEAYAEVEYEVKSGRYRASWSIAKNRNGNWNNYRMEIATLPDETLLPLKSLTDYPKKNAELIGLNYNQFIKSIVLAQGSFAEFLKADRHTRAKLLEDITGTHIYRRLGEAAYERYKESDSQVKLKEAELKGVVLKSDEEIAHLLALQEEKEMLCKKAESDREKWEKERQLVAEIAQLQEIKRRLAADQRTFQSRLLAFENHKNRLQQHESVSRFVAPITRLSEIEKQRGQLEREIATRRREVQEIRERKQQLLKKASALTHDVVGEENFNEVVDRFENEVLALIAQVNGLREQAKPIVEGLRAEIAKENAPWVGALSFNDYGKSLDVLETTHLALHNDLLRYPADFDPSEKLKKLDLQFATLSELRSLFSERNRLGVEGRTMKTELDTLIEIEKKEGPELSSVREKLAEVKQMIEKKNEALLEETTKQNLDEHRKQLKAGEPCPLCGSTHHPFLHEYVNQLVGLGQEIQSMKKELHELEKREKFLTIRVEGAIQSVKELTPRLTAMRAAYKEADGVVKRMLQELNLPANASSELLVENLKQVQAEKVEIDQWAKCREQKAAVERLTTGFRQLEKIKEQAEGLETLRKQRYRGEAIQSEVKTLLNQWGETLTTIKESEKQLKQCNEENLGLEKEFERLKNEVELALSEVGVVSVVEARRRLLSDQEYVALKNEDEKLKEEGQRIVAQEMENSRLLAERKLAVKFPDMQPAELAHKSEEAAILYKKTVEDIAQIKVTLQTETSQRERFQQMSEAYDQLNRAHRRWDLLAKYIGDASGNKFSSFAQSLTLNNLISLANARLLSLSDRYLLDKPRNDSDGLFVLDTYHGNQARAVSTLSGGETFTVSLALALALSDLASRNVRIESLFIDEGFGTLDSDTLESAVAILEKLQQESNKSVGVISHRQEMKERIPVQIQVNKGMDGTSNIEVIG